MSWTVGEPSNKNIGTDPPPALVFKLGLIILGSFGIINGGTKPHFSIPVLALNACRTPLLAVA